MVQEALGPADRIISSLLEYTDHLYHGRPGMIMPDAQLGVGVCWVPVTHKEEGDAKQKVVYRLDKVGKKAQRVKVGILRDDGTIVSETGVKVGEYRPAGIFPEVAKWMYSQVAEVWKLDNEFAARWASYAFGQEHRDLKVVLAAFMLVQSRKGDPVFDGGKVAFYDDDYRDVGEAMLLIDGKWAKSFDPKMILRVHELLSLPEIAQINRDLGFGKSARRPFYGRWGKAVEKWLRYREANPKMLEGLVKAGFRTTVMDLARKIGYKPETQTFFDLLRWKQKQSEDGRRTLAIGVEVKAAETWAGLSEEDICKKIMAERPGFKRIVGLVPDGLTRAIMAAAIEAGSLSDKDLVIATPTLEELGLLQVQDVRERWEKAVKAAEDMRAMNIAARVKSEETREKLQEAADTAIQKAIGEVTGNIRVYFMVDVSGSMQGAIEAAIEYISKFLQGFPPDKLHVAVFNTQGREIQIKHPSAAGVENAFRGIKAGGGTDYSAGVRVLQKYKPADGEDVLFMFIGDEEAGRFTSDVVASGLRPMAFGFVRVGGSGYGHYDAVRGTAMELGIPCFMVNQRTFTDPYAIPRIIRNLVASTPVGISRRSIVDMILETNLLRKPASFC